MLSIDLIYIVQHDRANINQPVRLTEEIRSSQNNYLQKEQ